MSSIIIYGASDDCVEVEGCKGGDEFALPDGDRWYGELIAPDGDQMAVSVTYGTNGCWHLGVGQVDESVALPSWPIDVRQHPNGYSVVMQIDAPEGTRLTNVS